MIRGNFFDWPEAVASGERSEALLTRPGLRIERILSMGQASPEGFWYDQAEDEFVALLAGCARLRIEGDTNALHFVSGDWVHLPAGCRHRVEWTSEDALWLAVHHVANQLSPSRADQTP